MGIRRYDIIKPSNTELRTIIGSIVGNAAVQNQVHVDLRETGVDIPAAQSLSSLDFRVTGTRPHADGLTVQGATADGNTINIQLGIDDALSSLSLVTPE